MTDTQHCGACGARCSIGAVCEGGVCACRDGAEACPSGCVDLSTDPNNCGACGNACRANELCTPTGCVDARACSYTPCDGACVNTDTSSQHCGACGNVCPQGSVCEQGRCSCADRSVDFAADVAPLLVANCTNAGCHSGARPKEGLDLSATKAFAELVGVRAAQCSDGRLLVNPGQPANSYLLQKMLGVNMCFGSQMPKAGVSIPASDIETITAWICQGAAP